ncbi:response regulator [Azospirillum agricola]|uniref:response regulator n=1 Tax=Azospirillum agricola TaxID=1720247 RepID=UPI000A0EEF7E|nr:response regulator [Azospirillum agricola]SMH36292.1 Response regulator receiver domain-containing protein [Azospirillum lipoferum]
MTATPPTDRSQAHPARGWGWAIAVPPLLAAAAGAAALWLMPPFEGDGTVVVLLAAAAGLTAGALLVAVRARAELGWLGHEHRRALAAAAWREDASRDDSLDPDGLGGDALGDAGLEEEPERPGGAAGHAADRQVLLDAMTDAVVLLGPDGWVVAANRAASAALGAAAVPDSRWDDGVVWPAPLVPERRALPGGGALIIGRDPLLDRLRTAQTDGMDAMAGLAAAIVHDVNNGLGAVAGYADFLATDLPADSPQADYAARILRAVDRSKTLMRQILAGARGAPPEFRPVTASQILNDAAARLRAALPAGAALSVRDEPELPAFPGHAGLLARCLAAAGTEIRGLVEPRLGFRAALWSGDLDASAAPHGWRVETPLVPRRRPHAMFELRSGGTPRPMADLLAAFDPLLSARAAARRHEAAAPSTALTVARWHDGGLSVWTHPTEGTVVRLFIPLPAAETVRPDQPSAAPRCHVLVVDDNPAMGDWLSDSLERLGCEVAVCESAGEALEIVMEEPASFDVVVAGPSAGGMSGPALIVRLKALRPGLSCVLCGAPEGMAEAEPVPADLFLPRPVDAVALARAIATFGPVLERP